MQCDSPSARKSIMPCNVHSLYRNPFEGLHSQAWQLLGLWDMWSRKAIPYRLAYLLLQLEIAGWLWHAIAACKAARHPCAMSGSRHSTKAPVHASMFPMLVCTSGALLVGATSAVRGAACLCILSLPHVLIPMDRHTSPDARLHDARRKHAGPSQNAH